MRILVFCVLMTVVGTAAGQTGSFYDFTVKDIDGNDFPMSSLKGKKIMVVNTASKCGYTPQYADLQALYEKYQDQNFVVIGFPANNFMKQEPGSSKSLNGVMDSEVKWNFQKYLIDERGILVMVIDPGEKPNSERVIKWIEGK